MSEKRISEILKEIKKDGKFEGLKKGTILSPPKKPFTTHISDEETSKIVEEMKKSSPEFLQPDKAPVSVMKVSRSEEKLEIYEQKLRDISKELNIKNIFVTKEEKELADNILVSINIMENYTKGKTKKDFLSDQGLKDQISYRLMVICGLVKTIDDLFPTFFKEVTKLPYKKIIAMRDKLAHDYWGLDYNIIWDSSTEGISQLKIKILEMLKETKEEDKGSGNNE